MGTGDEALTVGLCGSDGWCLESLFLVEFLMWYTEFLVCYIFLELCREILGGSGLTSSQQFCALTITSNSRTFDLTIGNLSTGCDQSWYSHCSDH